MSFNRALVLALVLAAGCQQKKDPGLVEVGEHHADFKALEARTQQVRLLRPDYTQVQAAAGVVEGWVADAVLKSRGKALDRGELAKERTRLEANQDIARLYREVARIYGEDSEAFLEVGLLPDMSLRRAVDLYNSEGAGTAGKEKMAAALLRQAQDAPAEFAAIATAAGAEVREVVVHDNGAVSTPAGAPLSLFSPNPQIEAQSARKVLELARSSTPGNVLGLVLRTADGHLLVKRVEDPAGKLRLLTATLRNPSFGEWLKAEADTLAQAGKLRACIHQEDLRMQYEKSVPTNLLHCK